MSKYEDATFYRRREAQELEKSERSSDPQIARLHWEIAQRYAYLANAAEQLVDEIDRSDHGAILAVEQPSRHGEAG